MFRGRFIATLRLMNSHQSNNSTVVNDLSRKLPVVAQAGPYKVTLEEGKRYSWCTCGLSEKQPFCDGKHKGSGMKSLKFEATPEMCKEEVYLCGCKQTANPPFCDGSHSKCEVTGTSPSSTQTDHNNH
ncbi:hypothetical protein C9374_000336 [Naegleria lovaniensis]|uniref:Iron-binding zinc finger CDGSH type domain-containing protein n=1 Tax=Naegleria lovaniensis TaxID=51637 RepID=A0AA88GU26_NAELO|nr:uncharacterized protein C9374_000336 [Naegleria lovaniensis]KAG2388897.1 hypothetical protein C9374_000336 [Naegleria lovaniensis]